MSFPDQTQPPPPHPVTSSPFASGDPAAFWPQYWQQGTDHHQPPPDLMPQFDNRPPLKKPRPSENPSHFPQSNPRVNPPNAAKGTSHIFYKTRMCAKFIDGTCRNGEHCTFAHGPGDLREPPPNWQEIIREKDRCANSGLGNNNWGGGGSDDQRTMIHRMKICKKFYNGEECPYGEKCNFLHERPTPPPVMAKRMKVDNNVAEQRESLAISVGVTGEFKGSDFDPKVFWKTRMCSKWEMGHCPFGDRCHYAHGQSELKFSANVDEAEQVVMNAMMASNIPRNPSSLSAFSNTPPPANLTASINGNVENNKASKWKLTKKINRIYADWLDDATPPHRSPTEERAI